MPTRKLTTRPRKSVKNGAQFLVDDGEADFGEAVVVKPVERSGSTPKIRAIHQNDWSVFDCGCRWGELCDREVSRKGARYLVDDGREAVAGETVERREATQKIKVILQNNIGRGV